MIDTFGEALRQLREERGWSLEQLAAKVSWSKAAVGLIETGRRRAGAQFATACDQALETTPILLTLCELDSQEDIVRRRALLGGLTVALGVGALTSYRSVAEVIRLDMLEAAGVPQDWDQLIASYQERLVTEPSAVFGDELLASMLTARYQMSEKPTADRIRASAHLSLLYGLWMGNLGNVSTGHNFYRAAEVLADRCQDRQTQVYVLARTAAGGPYQGLTRAQTEQKITAALELAGSSASAGVLEARAAMAQLAALTGDLAGGRAAIDQMWQLAERLATPASGPSPAARAASFAAYLEGRLGSLSDAERAWNTAQQELAQLPQWLAEAKLYFAMGMIRHGDVTGGLDTALAAARSLRYSVRVIRLGVDDVLTVLPVGYRDDRVAELATHGTTGPKPWELT